MRWMKAELHAHCSLDPIDFPVCDYSAEELISCAARLGYEVLAITCHNLDVWSGALAGFAAGLGVTLIPGMELVTMDRKHVLVYNFRAGFRKLNTLEKIRARKRDDTLVIAPHPYYPSPSCLGRRLEREIDLFDAVEISGFFMRRIDFNRRARRVAAEHGKPLVGNSDTHQLWQLGRTFSWVQAEPNVASILAAVRDGRVRVEARPITAAEGLGWWLKGLWLSARRASGVGGRIGRVAHTPQL